MQALKQQEDLQPEPCGGKECNYCHPPSPAGMGQKEIPPTLQCLSVPSTGHTQLEARAELPGRYSSFNSASEVTRAKCAESIWERKVDGVQPCWEPLWRTDCLWVLSEPDHRVC